MAGTLPRVDDEENILLTANSGAAALQMLANNEVHVVPILPGVRGV